MRFIKFDLTQNGQHIGSAAVKEQAINAAKGYAEKNKAPVTITAHTDDGKTREVIYREDGSIAKIWNIANSTPFFPEPGTKYRNAGGGTYLCISSYGTHANFINLASGWDFEAHGCRQYFDGSIEWDYSTGGHFNKHFAK